LRGGRDGGGGSNGVRTYRYFNIAKNDTRPSSSPPPPLLPPYCLILRPFNS
jgi:hypothetical protein